MSELERVKTNVEELKTGMHVSALDRPWSQTSFPLQGFLIRSKRELQALSSVCQYVYVDVTKSRFSDEDGAEKLFKSSANGSSKSGPSKDSVRKSSKPLSVNRERYKSITTLPKQNDLNKAASSLARITKSLKSIHNDIRAGATLDEHTLNATSDVLVDAVVKTPTAAFWAALLQKHHDGIYNHGLRAATWGLICGRHMGLESVELKRLAQGILLKDVYRLSEDKTVSNSSEAVLTSVELLRETGVQPKVISVVKYHRERFNGSGKPFGLAGEKIPFLARLASVSTAYDLMLYPIRGNKTPQSPSQATKLLYDQKGRAFQEELVIEFIEAMGLYPLGTLVKLSSGERAVVVKQNEGRRLKPSVLVLDSDESLTAKPGRTIDLSENLQITIVEDLPAQAGLEAGSYTEVFEDAFKTLISIEGNGKGSKTSFVSRIFSREN